ncbi:unnamed protein product [Thelazia callipaeda]|uniref:PDZ domain-containing protein n=1 Tax=Thelazia callipaeda TaxID=103827 RepID=A0A158RD16_THECL|nr:unnamed protein product [Thelazia callipaeda]
MASGEVIELRVNIEAGELPVRLLCSMLRFTFPLLVKFKSRFRYWRIIRINYRKVNLIVTFVQRNCALENHVYIGDKILAINNRSISNRQAFYHRGEKIKREQYVHDKSIIKQSGFIYLRVKLTLQNSAGKLGLGLVAQRITRRSTEPKIAGSNPAEQVKNGQNGGVYVTHVEQEMSAAECLLVGDRILLVEEETINDKKMAKKAILNALRSGNVTLVVERPDSIEARNVAAEVLAVRTPPHSDKH